MTLIVKNTTETPEKPGDESEKSASVKPALKKKLFKIEPPIFLVSISTALVSAVLQNQQLYQTCVAVYDYDKELCEPMLGVIAKNETSIAIENKIQPYMAKIITTTTLISTVLPAILALFLGPWSDKFGRRPVLMATITANLIGNSIATILVIIAMATPFNPWFYILSSIPLSLTGGTCALVTMVFCLVCDVMDESGIAQRLFFVQGALDSGTVLGNFLSSYILSAAGTIGVFAVANVTALIAFLILFFFVHESLEVKHERQTSRLREFFNFDLIKGVAKSSVRRRPNYERAVIWGIMFCLVAITFVIKGEMEILYTFLHNKFNVTLEDFPTFNYSSTLIKIVGSILTFVILRIVFKVPVIVLALISILGGCAEGLVHTLAQQFWQMYLAAVLDLMGIIKTTTLQAILAGLVESTEIGKVYAVISSLQTLSPLASAPTYKAIYNATLETFPGAMYLLSAATYLLCIVLIGTLYNMQRISVARTSKLPVAA